ncbi:hypothetical protein LCGC14_2307660 [marine sediment metagenome]|uniref:30S ribosomal protein S2 n=1 Tax=marine sediment metagenome TaxID=412755 RepID=A0A0F9EYW3_9ZZZZ
MKSLLEAGVHFGHQTRRWNPKMKRYIFGKRNLIHIINVKETLKGLLLAKRLLAQIIGSGKDVLLVGTKRQARKAERQQRRATRKTARVARKTARKTARKAKHGY